MGQEKASDQTLVDAVDEMVRDRFLDGVTRLLESKFRALDPVLYEDAVSEAVKKLLEAGERREIRDPRAYLTTIAINEMKRALRRAAIEVLPEAPDEGDEEWFDEHGVNPDDRPTEDAAVGRLVYEYVTGIVRAWETEKLRVTTLLVLEGAYIGEPLSGRELTERLSDIVGQDVEEDTARQLRKRGLDRLRQHLSSEGFDIHD